MFNKILQIDKELGLSIALELAARNVDVYYCCDWDERFPKSNFVGSGFDVFKGFHLGGDFYSVLKSIPEDEKSDWLILISDVGFNNLADWLRDDGWLVFGPGKKGQNLENNRAFGKDFMLKSGINIANFYQFRTLSEVEDFLKDASDFSRKYVLKIDAFSDFLDTIKGTPQELLKELEFIDKDKKRLDFGFILEEFVSGVEVAVTAFFNGLVFLRPVLLNFESEWGGFMIWEDDCKIFDLGLSKCESGLRELGYKGVIDLNGIYVRKNFWDFGSPAKDIYLGLEFSARFGYPWGRIYTKMIDNLLEVLEATAKGSDVRIKLNKKCAYFISAFKNLEFKDDDTIFDLDRIFEFEKQYPDKFGISFDRVFLDESGSVCVLPGYPRMFQMIGFGNNYFEAVNSLQELFDLCSDKVFFQHRKRDLLWDIRDRIIFLEGWLDDG